MSTRPGSFVRTDRILSYLSYCVTECVQSTICESGGDIRMRLEGLLVDTGEGEASHFYIDMLKRMICVV